MKTPDAAFWRGRRVLVTGHTGFKGAWLTLALQRMGARVCGISLAPEAGPALFTALAPWPGLDHVEIDITDASALTAAVRSARPSVVFHLAAQAIVGRGYREPARTFETNVHGTANLLESLRGQDCAAAVVVTSDKVYRNDGLGKRFVESDPLGGDDPYSASKAAAEIVVASWRASFGHELPALATARSGNVVGGGDFGEGRLIPDLVRAQWASEAVRIRQPDSTRPWQYVLDVLDGYLTLAEALVQHPTSTPAAVNFGPQKPEPYSVRQLIALFEQAYGVPVTCEFPAESPFREVPQLGLDPALAAAALGWRSRLDCAAALAASADWYRHWHRRDNMRQVSTAVLDGHFG